MEHLLFAPSVLGARKDVKMGSASSVREKSPLRSSGPVTEGEVTLHSGRAPWSYRGTCLDRYHSVWWGGGGPHKPEVPGQEQLKVCSLPLWWNNRENSKYLLELGLHPRKQRACRKHASVLYLSPGSLTLIFGYSLLPGWTD